MGSNNFCQRFDYGASAEGYLTYDQTLLQIEDCVDILKSLHPGIDFIFLFDYYCGHDKGRKYGFNLTKINSGYGRAQRNMHPTKFKHNFVYLGPNEQIIEVENDKNMSFQEGGNGTFWMNPQEHLATNFVCRDDLSLKDKK